ncbi:MAG: OsmC family protein [Silicimonas sp.]|nr:OsmC family protein [Silicimonas sp.]NNF91534.1 OsmC family protein [Boseongicola sp.]RZW06471.1 MAG: OsmC family peroxiredoxin [Paracoccaceae bacterium]MBT8425464.1 OsmC family protein [Silicimonas sp.]NND18503.1 OsmC family protein [Silicimonas sp.]
MIVKSGSAEWSGNLKDGRGHVSTESGVLENVPYSFAKRFEDTEGANPEELLGAAHAACFSMAFANILSEFDLKADSIETKASVTLDPSAPSITKVHLDMTASIPDASEDDFQAAAQKAKENCPVSKLFKAEITMDAKLS